VFLPFSRDAADRVVKGNGKYEELVVCSQEIAASTTQLVVASKVKASRGSDNLYRLADASKGVTTATGRVVACAKSASQRIEEIGEY
jgi:huntingtin interacting protein 1